MFNVIDMLDAQDGAGQSMGLFQNRMSKPSEINAEPQVVSWSDRITACTIHRHADSLMLPDGRMLRKHFTEPSRPSTDAHQPPHMCWAPQPMRCGP